MESSLEAQFDQAMMDIYIRAKKEAKYNASRFLEMLNNHRGLRTAQILLHSDKVSEGYVSLWERQRLDLTVEALILQPRWATLFSEDERKIAHDRLVSYKYDFPSAK